MPTRQLRGAVASLIRVPRFAAIAMQRLRPCASVAPELVHAKPCVFRFPPTLATPVGDIVSTVVVTVKCRSALFARVFHPDSSTPKDLHRPDRLAPASCLLRGSLRDPGDPGAFRAPAGSPAGFEALHYPSPDPSTPALPCRPRFLSRFLGLLDPTRTVELKTDSTRDRAREKQACEGHVNG